MENTINTKIYELRLLNSRLKQNEINSLNSENFESSKDSSNTITNKDLRLSIPKISSNTLSKNLLKYSNLRISRDFFLTDAVTLAQRLLGKIIVRILDNQIIRCRIVETEAYMGEIDTGSHVSRYGKTERTKAFWCEGGHLYIYIIYGINHCMNIIANDKNTPQGCLIRAAEPLEGIDLIKRNRGIEDQKNLTNGPGKLTSSLKIDKSFNCLDLCKSDEVFLINCDDIDYKFQISCSSRVNIDYGKEYRDIPWRFFIKDNKFVSKVNK